MADNKEYMTRQENLGTIQISEDVVASIAVNAAMEVDGVGGLMNANMSDIMGGKKLTAKGIRVEMNAAELTVSLFLMMRYGCVIGDVAKKVQDAVCAALMNVTGCKVAAVNVHVGGICFN